MISWAWFQWCARCPYGHPRPPRVGPGCRMRPPPTPRETAHAISNRSPWGLTKKCVKEELTVKIMHHFIIAQFAFKDNYSFHSNYTSKLRGSNFLTIRMSSWKRYVERNFNLNCFWLWYDVNAREKFLADLLNIKWIGVIWSHGACWKKFSFIYENGRFKIRVLSFEKIKRFLVIRHFSPELKFSHAAGADFKFFSGVVRICGGKGSSERKLRGRKICDCHAWLQWSEEDLFSYHVDMYFLSLNKTS